MDRFYKQLLFVILALAVIVAGGVVIYAVNNRGNSPVLWLKFDEGQGQYTYDASGQGNTGTMGTSTAAEPADPTWKTEDMCKSGKCLYFDGTNDAVSVANTISVKTVAFWMRPASTTDNILELANNSVYISISSGSVTTTGFTSPSIYVNGVLNQPLSVDSWTFVEITTDTAISAASINIGEANSDYFQGYLDDIKLFNYARSASQVKSDFIKAAGGKGTAVKVGSLQEQQNASEGLVAYWKMDESSWSGTSNEVVDSSGNGNHGTAAGGATLANTTSTAKFNMAGNFDGTDDYVSITNTISGVQTIEFWIKPTSNTASMINLTASAYITAASGVITATGLTGSIIYVNGAAGSTFTANVWQHIAVTATAGVSANAITIGKANSAYTTGQIDDVKVYNKARTVEQIRRDYETGPPPVAHWKMDENSGQYAFDISGNQNVGTLGSGATADSADPTWVSGKYGSALKFDGSNDFVSGGNSTSLQITGSFSVSAWIKTSATNGQFFGKFGNQNAAGWMIEVRSGTFGLGIKKDINSNYWLKRGNTAVNDNNWHFVEAVYVGNGTQPFLYVDGILQSLTDVATVGDALNGFTESGQGVEIGRNHGFQSEIYSYFNGLIDDVRVYNYARTPKQIMGDMNAGHGAVGSPVGSYAAYWPFDEGYGTIAYDKSTNVSNGAISGAAWTTAGKFGKALSFDGADDYVNAGHNSSLSLTDFTVSVWFKWESEHPTDIYRTVISKGLDGEGSHQNFMIYVLDADHKVYARVGHTGGASYTFSSSVDVSDGNWYHAVLVYDSSVGRGDLYINGVSKNPQTGLLTAYTNVNADVTLGIWQGATYGEWDGLIDEVKIYPFALSPLEVKEEYDRASSLKLGSTGGPQSSTASSSDSKSSEYCVPGSSDYCVAPVAHWKMDEMTGQYAYDISGNGNAGTLGSGATADSADPAWKISGCHSGSCLSFDGTNDYVDLGNNTGTLDFTGTQAFSISTWIKPTSLATTYHAIIGKDDANYQYNLFLTTDGGVYFGVGDSNNAITSAGAVSINNWYHIEAVSDGTTAWIYVNGAMVTSGTPTSMTHRDSNVYIGQFRASDLTYPFQGIIDDVRIYNYARTPAQIAYDYNRGGPVGWWKMDDGWDTATTCDATTSVVRDNSYACKNGGTCNTGTLYLSGSPATSTAWSEGKYGCAIDFDGIDDYISLSSTVSFGTTTPFAVSAWFKTSANGVIFSDYNSSGANDFISFQVYSNGGRFSFRDTAANNVVCQTSGLNYLDNQWHHIVGVRDVIQDKCILYVDGAVVATASDTTVDDINSNRIPNIGRHLTGSNLFDGIIDDVRIYNYALDTQQVKTLYNEGAAVRFGPGEGLP